jgi:branched-chain amino acid transport system ATP-binding protein
VLEVSEVTVRFGGLVALDDASLHVEPGTVCGLIGPNGAGKTTLFNCVSRLVTPVAGSIRWDGHELLGRRPHQIADLGIARTFQNLALVPSLTLRENVMLGAHRTARSGFAEAALRLPRVRREEREMRVTADEALARLGLERLADHPAAALPYGTLKRLEIARALAQQPRLLMLDEPAAGLSHGEVDELAETLRALREDLGLTVLLVEHHMGLVMRVSEQVVVLDFGQVIAAGTPDEVRNDERVVEAYLGVAA